MVHKSQVPYFLHTNNYNRYADNINSGSEMHANNSAGVSSNLYQPRLHNPSHQTVNSQRAMYPSLYTQQPNINNVYQTIVVPNSAYVHTHVEAVNNNNPPYTQYHNIAPVNNKMDPHIMMQMYQQNLAMQSSSRIQPDQQQMQTYHLNHQGSHVNRDGRHGYQNGVHPSSHENLHVPTQIHRHDIQTNITALNESLSLDRKQDPLEFPISDDMHKSQIFDSPSSEELKMDSKSNPADEKAMLLEKYSVSITSLSTLPMSGRDIVNSVKSRTTEVITTYMPCVDFLVVCQQELRQALAIAQKKSGGKSMTTSKFYDQFFRPLPTRFYNRFHSLMDKEKMTAACVGLDCLLSDVRKVERPGRYEDMKHAFLGGMRDGESWGLRRWMSQNSGAIRICNDLELILAALRKESDSEPALIEIARLVRPLAKAVFDRLMNEIPKAYQERSSAHPYLPFFHRLENILKGLSEFDPEDDDVICLDDSDEEDVCIKVDPTVSADIQSVMASNTQNVTDSSIKSVSSNRNIIEHINIDEDDEEDESSVAKTECTQEKDSADDQSNNVSLMRTSLEPPLTLPTEEMTSNQKESCTTGSASKSAEELAQMIETRAFLLDQGNDFRPDSLIVENFWSTIAIYVNLLRLVRNLLVHPYSEPLINISSLVNGNKNQGRRYYDIIKHPLFLSDIVYAMSDGKLEGARLSKWNIFNGRHLIEAVDLVFANILSFRGDESDRTRTEIESIRRMFWKEIHDMANKKNQIPPRHKLNSDYIIRKKN